MEIYDPGLFFCVAVEKSIAWKRRSKIWDGERKAGGAETKIYVIMHRKIDVPGDGGHNGNM